MKPNTSVRLELIFNGLPLRERGGKRLFPRIKKTFAIAALGFERVCRGKYYLQKIIALADASLLVVVPSTLRVFLVEDGRVVPPRTEVDDAILMSRVEFGEFFRQGLHWRKHKLERNLGNRPFFLGFEPLWDRRGRVEL